jgi:hypothetical protein
MTLENIAIIFAIAVPLAGLFLWAMKSTVAPLRVVINNNTAVMDRIMNKLDNHEETLGEHAVRITKIETVHEIERGNE